MYYFDKINIRRISKFFESIINTIEPTKRYVQNRFNKQSDNFSETYSFLNSLGMVFQKNEEILIHPNLISLFHDSVVQEEELTKQLINELINPKQFIYKYIVKYFSFFKFDGNKYTFIPTLDERIKYSGVRNLLMELGIVSTESRGKSYYILREYENIYHNIVFPSGSLTPNMLDIINFNNEKLGSLAENKIIEYEKLRLSAFPTVQSIIIHEATNSVDAGYDILSYEVPTCDSNQIARFIEVKAVSPETYKFYFSKNEMKVASQFCNQYYLYLLPVSSNSIFDIDGLKIIKNPMKHLFKKENNWSHEVEKLSFRLN